MNTRSKKEMKKLLKEFTPWSFSNIKVGDFGSYNVNGTYKSIIPDKWIYTGFDILPGPNVDVVMKNEFDTGFLSRI